MLLNVSELLVEFATHLCILATFGLVTSLYLLKKRLSVDTFLLMPPIDREILVILRHGSNKLG